MAANTIPPGTILGQRFAIVGVLGTGGTATVYLAVDQLRGSRIALKVVHPHLANDPAVRRRLEREVQAATLLQHEAALVPWDSHELDGHLCLAMPYHDGQTLSEHIAAHGPLAIPAVRSMGMRLGSALAAAHRNGLLHRDVTANNVLLKDGMGAVITDFGLSKTQTEATRSTGMLGTAGYAAPEVYAGERAGPRADLYGLGCVLYFAVTGQTPFGTGNPMATLQRQLADDHKPIVELRPECPAELAETIETLLRKDPDARPQGAREVVDALTAERSALTPDLPETSVGAAVHIEPGAYFVVVKERTADRARRKQLRIERRKERRTLETEVSRRARDLMTGVLTFVGVKADEIASPEELLLEALAEEASVPTTALQAPPALIDKHFVWADGISEAAADRLMAEAKSSGFEAEVGHHIDESSLRARLIVAMMVAGWVGTAAVATTFDGLLLPYIAFMVFLTVLTPALTGRRRSGELTKNAKSLPVAYRADLSRWLAEPVQGRFPIEVALTGAAPPPALEAQPTSRAQALLRRTTQQLDALGATVEELDLNAVATSDLNDTMRDLRNNAVDLSEEIERLDKEIAVESEDTGWIEPRLRRLRTKERAGESIDPKEISKLEAALEAHQHSEALTASLESQLTAATAGMLEIASTAAGVRRELLTGGDPASEAREALDKLKRESAAADRARREMARRAHQR